MENLIFNLISATALALLALLALLVSAYSLFTPKMCMRSAPSA